MSNSTSTSTSPTRNHHNQHHRSDVFDIPQIDHHLLQHLLVPRIINSIRFIYPQVYLDWTTKAIVVAVTGEMEYKMCRPMIITG